MVISIKKFFCLYGPAVAAASCYVRCVRGADVKQYNIPRDEALSGSSHFCEDSLAAKGLIDERFEAAENMYKDNYTLTGFPIEQTVEEIEAYCSDLIKSANGIAEEEVFRPNCSSSGCEKTETRTKNAIIEELRANCSIVNSKLTVEQEQKTSERLREIQKEKLEAVFRRTLEGKTVFVIGIPQNLLQISELAREVFVLERNRQACEEFLASKEGACTMKNRVELVCMKQSNVTDEKKMADALDAAAYLIKSRYSNIPPDILYLVSDYPIAATMRFFAEIDQSTLLFVHHRISHEGLKVLGTYYRQDLLLFPSALDSTLTKSATFLLLRKKFMPPPPAEKWKDYLQKEWRLQHEEQILKLFNLNHKKALELVAGNKTGQVQLNVEGRIIRQHFFLGTDDDRKAFLAFIAKLETDLAVPKKTSDIAILALYRTTADAVVQQALSTSTLKDYFGMIVSKVNELMTEDKPLSQALLGDLIVATKKLESSGLQLDALINLFEEVMPRLLKDGQPLFSVLSLLRMAVESFSDLKDSFYFLKQIENCIHISAVA